MLPEKRLVRGDNLVPGDIGQIIVSGLMLGGVYAIISIGLTIIFGVVRIVNFAHGEFLMLAMYFTYFMFQKGLDPYISVFLIVPVLFLIGILVQRVMIQPILDTPPTIKILATLGLSLALQNLALMVWKADYRTIKTTYQSAVIKMGDVVISYPKMVAFFVTIIVAIALFIFLKTTFTGKAIRAVAHDRGAAMLMGINIYRTYMLAFGIGLAMVGLAGALLMPVYYVFPTVGQMFVLTSFVVVVLGGLGSIPGAFVGGLLIGLVESFAGMFIDPQLKEAVYFIIFFFVLLFKPSGIFGTRGQAGGESA